MNIGGTTTTASYDGEMNPRLKLTAVPYAFSAGQLSTVSGANSTKLDFVTPTATNSILLPDANGTVCLDNSAACGFASSSGSSGYIQNGTGLQTTANFNIQSASTSAISGCDRGLDRTDRRFVAAARCLGRHAQWLRRQWPTLLPEW